MKLGTLAIVLAGAGLAIGAGIAWTRLPAPSAGGRISTFDAADPDLGRKAYVMCLSCHGADGHGVPGYAPGLVGSPWLVGDPATAVLITLHGFDASLEPDAPYTSTRMTGHAHQLSDPEIAALLTWLRRQWGNAAGPVDAAMVGWLRQRYAGRSTPWTPAALRARTGTP